MAKLHVAASRQYDVIIEHGLLDSVGDLTAELKPACTAVIVAGENAFKLYAKRLIASLERAGFSVKCFVHQTGETAKSLETYGKLLNFLCNERIVSSDVIFALGGGVTGDLAGFAAATYLRGIDYIQLPTTLLAAVDSSVGGKTAINLDSGKNQAGCFHQPLAVFCDLDTLSTLDDSAFRCGCAEIIKYAIFGGSGELFELLKTQDIRQNAEQIIAECVKMKRDIVEKDELDKSLRRLLNLGHSFGHAIEKCSDYAVSHGDAVAIGMVLISRAAVRKGLLSEADCKEIIALIKKYSLPTETELSADELFTAACSDKKIAGGTMQLVVPRKIGHCEIIPVGIDEMKEWLLSGLG